MTSRNRSTGGWTYTHRGPLLIFLGVAVVIGLSYLTHARLHPVKVKEQAPTSYAVTLLTTPLAVLPPHPHFINNTEVDSARDPGHATFVHSDVYTAPEDLWITHFSYVSKNAPKSVLHHLVLQKEGVPAAECPNRNQALYDSGNDSLGETDFMKPFGIYLKKGDRIYLDGMLHNPTPPEGAGGTYRDVEVGYTITFERPNTERTRPLEYYSITLDDGQHCKNAQTSADHEADNFVVPAKTLAYELSSRKESGINPTRLIFPSSGILLGFGGHVHEIEGGKKLDVYLNGTLVQTFVAEHFGTDPWNWTKRATMPWHPTQVQKGDALTLKVLYSNPNPFPIRDAMAQSGIYFAPDPAP